MVSGVCLQLNHPSENQETLLLKFILLVSKTSTHIRGGEKQKKKKERKKKEFIRSQHLSEGRGFVNSVCTEICTSMKDFKYRGAENGSKIATKAAYAFGFINFIRLAI